MFFYVNLRFLQIQKKKKKKKITYFKLIYFVTKLPTVSRRVIEGK